METEQLSTCTQCVKMVAVKSSIRNLRGLIQHCLLTAALLCLLSGTAVASPVRRRSRVISDAWRDPCYSSGSGVAASIPLPAPAQQPQGDHLNNHLDTMTARLTEITDRYADLEMKLLDRLPSRDWAQSELQDLSIEGMAMGDLQYLTSDLEWLEITQRTYELVSRAYIYVDRMVQDESAMSHNNLKAPIMDLREDMQYKLMCPMYLYAMKAHDTHPVDDVTHTELTRTHSSLFSISGVRRNERNFMVIRDLKRLTDHMKYELYTS